MRKDSTRSRLSARESCRTSAWLFSLAGVFVPLLVLASIWIPELTHYYVPGAEITSDIVRRSRSQPDDAVLAEIGDMSLLIAPAWKTETQLRELSKDLLQRGRVKLRNYPEMQIGLPLRMDDMERGSPSWQLEFAALVLPDFLLDDYRKAGTPDSFEMARKMILAWARAERTAWLSRGFMWNDHALAARVRVLARFWLEYRRYPGFDPEEAAQILQFAVRTGQMLAKSSHFTFATNHGIMQNIALWQLALAFPELPGAAEYQRVAQKRFAQQMEYYINNEGVVLEHSAGYHRDGLELIGMAFRCMTLFSEPIPDAWWHKYDRGKEFYAQIRRPDGSLPLFGDTGGGSDAVGPRIARRDDHGQVASLRSEARWRPLATRSLHPIAGYATWWSGLGHWPRSTGLSQTVVAWSYFRGHGHKLADELSVMFWANGVSWWNNIGYWPYGDTGRDEAATWVGSNAPHHVSESSGKNRHARLRGYAWNEDVVLVDLDREAEDGYRVRRQVADVRGEIGVVIDSPRDPGGRPTRSVWRLPSEAHVRETRSTPVYQLQARAHGTTLDAAFLGPGIHVEKRVGGKDSVIGWASIDRSPKPTTAFVITHPSNDSWAAVVWAVGRDGQGSRLEGPPVMREWRDAEHWELVIPSDQGQWTVGRSRGVFQVLNQSRPRQVLRVAEMQEDLAARKVLDRSFSAAAASASGYVDLFDYRMRMSYVILVAFLFQETFFMLFTRALGRRANTFRVTGIAVWAIAGIWLGQIYFRN